MSARIDEVTEAVAAALFEQATWHPPLRGKDWSEASPHQKRAWLAEAEALLEPLRNCPTCGSYNPAIFKLLPKERTRLDQLLGRPLTYEACKDPWHDRQGY